MVAVAEVAVFAGGALHEFLAVYALGIHGDEGGHAVAAVDVERLGNGAETVGGIDVAAVFHVVAQAPAELVVLTVLPIVGPEVVEVVDVGALGAYDFAENAVLGHVERVHLEPVVAAVFENHAVLAGFLAQVDEFPALLEVHGRRHLDGRVLAVFKGTLGHGEMVVPVGGHVNEVDVVALAELFVSLGAGVDVGGRKACLAQELLAGFGAGFLIVAEGYNLHAGDVGEALHGAGATHAKAHKGHAHGFEFGGRQTEHVLLPGGTRGRVDYDGSFVPMPLGGRGERLGLSLQTAQGQQRCERTGQHAVQLFHTFD